MFALPPYSGGADLDGFENEAYDLSRSPETDYTTGMSLTVNPKRVSRRVVMDVRASSYTLLKDLALLARSSTFLSSLFILRIPSWFGTLGPMPRTAPFL